MVWLKLLEKWQFLMFLAQKKNKIPLDFLPATSLPRNAKADVVRDDLRPPTEVIPPKRLEGCSVQPPLVQKVP